MATRFKNFGIIEEEGMVFIGGERFPIEEITKEEADRINYEKDYLVEEDNKYYRTTKTDQFEKAMEYELRTQEEIKTINMEQWLEENRPELNEKRRAVLEGNAGFVYHLFRNHRDFFENEVITVEEAKRMTFEYLETEDIQKIFEELSRIERELEEKRKKAISPEEIEESFERMLHRKNIIEDPQLIQDLPKIIPRRLDQRHQVEKTETSEEIMYKYQKTFGNERVTWVFVIPKEKYREGQVPTFGDKARKTLLAIVGFAVEEKNLTPKFKKVHILGLINKDGIPNRDYDRLNDILQTFAFATYDIENKKQGKGYRRSIGHIIDNVDWYGKGKGSYISVSLNKQYFRNLTSLIEGEKKDSQYLSIPKDRLTETLPPDESNFINYLDSLRGHRRVYPILVKTILTEKLGYPKKDLKAMGLGKIDKILYDCLMTAKKMNRLANWKIIDYGKNRRDILNYKYSLELVPHKKRLEKKS